MGRWSPLDTTTPVRHRYSTWQEEGGGCIFCTSLFCKSNQNEIKCCQAPQKWNLPALFYIGIVLGVFPAASSLLLLYWSLDSWNPTSVFHHIGLGNLTYGQITTAIYLNLSISDFLMLFSARTGEQFWWGEPRPAAVLVAAAVVSLSISTVRFEQAHTQY